ARGLGRRRRKSRRRHGARSPAAAGNAPCSMAVGGSLRWETAMAKSPDRPTGSGLETDSRPWAPSPGSQDPPESATAAAEGFTEAPTSAEEAIGGGSHSSGDPPAEAGRDTASATAEQARHFAKQAAAGAVTVRDELAAAMLARPSAAGGIALAGGLLGAVR